MTYYTATSSATLDSALTSTTPKEGDILLPSATFTHTTPNPNVTYVLNTVYVYNGTIFEPEEKADGKVGGWSITSTQIKSTNDSIILDNQNETITIGSGAGQVILDGAATGTEAVINHAEFQLKADGSAVFSGDLEAASGSFGNTTINGSSTLTIGTYVENTSGDIKIDNTNGIVARDSSNEVKFSLSTDGELNATNATITGAITATSGSFTGAITSTSGTIGGFEIGETDLTAGTGDTGIGVSTGDISFFAGDDTPATAPFRVTKEGSLIATDATITGAITATSGDIAGWEISETTLSKNNVSLDSTGVITVGDADDVAVLSAIDDDYRI